jgi:DNA-binding NarL/FixJ family response regulator
MIRLMLVDDHKVIRDGIRYFLEKDLEYSVVAEASDGSEAIKMLEGIVVDVVLMDINMNGMDGIMCTEIIAKKYPDVKVVALSMFSEIIYIKRIIRAGASGYLLKNSGEEEVKKAIKEVYNHRMYYGPGVMEKIMADLAGNGKEKHPHVRFNEHPDLTNREKEILILITNEYSNSEIAEKLFISLRTVDAHKRNLLEKTGAKNIAGLVLFAIQHELI